MDNISDMKMKPDNITAYSVKESITPDQINLKSFESKGGLNPIFFSKNGILNKKVRVKLLEISRDFIKYLDLNDVMPINITIVGSLAGYNWSKYSDVDLHLIYKWEDIDKNKDLVRNYVDSKKQLWNNEKNIKIYGFPVELYVEFLDDGNATNGRYSIIDNEWIEFPIFPEPIGYRNFFIKREAAKLINLIDNYEKLLKIYKGHPGSKPNNLDLYKKINTLSVKIKNMRKESLMKYGEMGSFNIVFKILRRTKYLQKLYNLRNEIYGYMKSLPRVL